MLTCVFCSYSFANAARRVHHQPHAVRSVLQHLHAGVRLYNDPAGHWNRAGQYTGGFFDGGHGDRTGGL